VSSRIADPEPERADYDLEAVAAEHAYGRARAYALACGIDLDPIGAIVRQASPDDARRRVDLRRGLARIAREAAGCDRHDSVPVVVLGGRLASRAPVERGEGYGFRWLGRWKSAPGSYIPSTRRVVVGWDWLARRAPSLRYDRPSGAWVHDHRAVHLHGCVARYAYDGRRAWHVTLPDGTCATIARRETAGAREAIRRVLADARRARREHAQHVHVWVTPEDSIRAGNCAAETRAIQRRLERALGAGPLGAVRADLLLEIRDDMYARRAMVAAAQRAAR